MDQETIWLKRYQEVVDFIEANHRNPSKHRSIIRIVGGKWGIRKGVLLQQHSRVR